MNNNNRYWQKRDELRNKAVKHTEDMMNRYSEEINSSKRNTIIYSDNTVNKIDIRNNKPIISVIDSDTVSAIFNNTNNNDNVTILNFASYNNPGGKFIDGSSAQEEMLCHESFLYNILMWNTDYYEWNNKNKNKGMYTNRALYIPNVIFERDGNTRKVNVITCAAPNRSLIKRYNAFTEDENTKALSSRIHFIKAIAEHNRCDKLILGAYGCGVFAQDPYKVASIFKDEFKTSNIKNIIYAIPKGDNLIAFQEVFKDETNKTT